MALGKASDTACPKMLCPICNKSLSSLNRYIKHLQKHESPGGFCCTYCEESFCLYELLKKHKDEKHKVLACQICHATFATAEEYRTHIKDIHNGVDRSMFICAKCGIEFKTLQAAKRHNETQCGEIKPHPCDECTMAFYTKYNLAEHKKIHKGEKKFCCSYCGKSFLTHGRLVIHERSHTGEKPYKCDVCGKCFAHRESIVTHSSLHTGVKLVVCKCCGARFSCHSNLIKHRRTRKDTCGLAQYDSTKETKRSRNSRIPATLMSSEIKIVRASKVLNPNEQHQKCRTAKAKPNKPKSDSDKEEVFSKGTRQSLRIKNTVTVSSDIEQKQHEEPANDSELDDIGVDLAFENPMNSDDSNHSSKSPIPERILDVIPVKTEENLLTEKELNLKVEESLQLQEELLPKVKDDELPEIEKSDRPLLKLCRVILEDISLKYPNLPAFVAASQPTTNPEKISNKPKLRRNRMSLRKKLNIFKKERVYDCKFCMKVYHIRKPYEKHLHGQHNKTHEEVRDIFKDEDNDIPGDLVHRCPICSKVYLMAKRLKDHLTYHGPGGNLIYKCPCYCKIFFSTKEEAVEHSKTAHKSAIYCDICDKYSQTPEALRVHKKSHSAPRKPTDRNLICDKCAKSFTSRTCLTDHVRSNCGKNPLYQCNICNKNFSTAGILKTHSLLHKDETPYVCDKCGKSFKIKSQYKTHLKHKHSEDKAFKCSLCPKEYPYRESLLTHMAIHTGIKRYSCSGCGKRFTCISNLQAHRKVYADTCGLQPLNSKPSQYIGLQKGELIMGSKPYF